MIEVIKCGVSYLIYLYNRMIFLNYRDLGVVGVIFDSNLIIEIIFDGIYIIYVVLRIVYK